MVSDKKRMVVYFIAILFVIFDRLLKIMAAKNFFNPAVDLIGGFFRLQFSANQNIAFSLDLFSNSLLIPIIITIIIVLVCVLVYDYGRKQLSHAGALASLILGASSNLYDRIRFGYVVDYLDLKYFTVFNLADCLVVCGAIGILYAIFRAERSTGKVA